MTSRASRSSLLAVLLAPALAAAIPAPPDFELPRVSLADRLRALDAAPVREPVPMPVGFGETGHGDYRRAAELLEAAGLDFPEIFRRACAEAVRRGGGEHEAKVMLAGLASWLGDRERPRAIGLQGRLDWAFHFVYGAWLESIAPGLGERAGLRKEERDAFAPGNAYDLDDLAATLIGARWVNREAARLADWAAGRRRLEDLPPMRLGKLAPRALATPAQVQSARDFAASALP